MIPPELDPTGLEAAWHAYLERRKFAGAHNAFETGLRASLDTVPLGDLELEPGESRRAPGDRERGPKSRTGLTDAPPAQVIAIGKDDEWPNAISDGPCLPCSDCGELPRFDYIVSDDFWRRHVPEKPARLSVVCLPCLDRRCGGEGLAEALRFIQWTGTGHTVELRPTRAFTYEPRDTAPVQEEDRCSTCGATTEERQQWREGRGPHQGAWGCPDCTTESSPDACRRCGGTGVRFVADPFHCPRCKGTGKEPPGSDIDEREEGPNG